MYYRTEGVILKRRNFGEADRILSIFTRDLGKVSVLARGVRRPKSKKAGHVEIGNWCKIFIARGKNLDLLCEVELKNAFGIADFSTIKANKIYHLLEIIDSLCEEKQKNVQVFDLIIKSLKEVVGGRDFNIIAASFKVKLLWRLGFFSTRNLKDSSIKDLLAIFETYDLEYIKSQANLSSKSYLKLLAFLDSIIERITEKKLKTPKFLNV